METLKVSSTSEPKLVGGAIAGIVRGAGKAEVIAVGAAAVNQTVKSICVARGYVADEGIDLVFNPSFVMLPIDNTEKTGIRFVVEKR